MREGKRGEWKNLPTNSTIEKRTHTDMHCSLWPGHLAQAKNGDKQFWK
jgi:hypothetical protein